MAGLVTILERIRNLGIVCEIWLDGSFLTEKIEPDDVDFIVFAPMAILEPESPEKLLGNRCRGRRPVRARSISSFPDER
jgi:hypothetical protein